ncbi:hypothetical protein CTAYLR_007229 [Chrysophaeum taylorii]|uniref:Uncharacterized protein n=1 Tax=Chrysophaeum taylorii TaxID=2483200 RepID=A0AAD7UCZ5_9STRA|nr:hypothetical protein CTAYLR_007229 [Chrysophaeum taylorii]
MGSLGRIRNAIFGAFAGDAACMTTHWIYDPKEMASVAGGEEPEFKTPASPRFYSASEFPGHYETGSFSPYGEQLLFVAQYVAKAGEVEGEAMTEAMRDWATAYTGRKDHATQAFLANVANGLKFPESGADDNQAHCFLKAVPVTCLYAGTPERRDKVEEAIRVHQNNDEAVRFGLLASDLLERVILGDSLEEAVGYVEARAPPEAAKAFDDARSKLPLSDLLTKLSNEIMKDKPDSPFYNLAARSCALPSAFVAPVHELLNQDSYVSAMRENILAAGDTCSRAIFLGAVVAAARGPPPQAWVDKLTTAKDSFTHKPAPIADLVADIADKIVAHNEKKNMKTTCD